MWSWCQPEDDSLSLALLFVVTAGRAVGSEPWSILSGGGRQSVHHVAWGERIRRVCVHSNQCGRIQLQKGPAHCLRLEPSLICVSVSSRSLPSPICVPRVLHFSKTETDIIKGSDTTKSFHGSWKQFWYVSGYIYRLTGCQQYSTVALTNKSLMIY